MTIHFPVSPMHSWPRILILCNLFCKYLGCVFLFSVTLSRTEAQLCSPETGFETLPSVCASLLSHISIVPNTLWLLLEEWYNVGSIGNHRSTSSMPIHLVKELGVLLKVTVPRCVPPDKQPFSYDVPMHVMLEEYFLFCGFQKQTYASSLHSHGWALIFDDISQLHPCYR